LWSLPLKPRDLFFVTVLLVITTLLLIQPTHAAFVSATQARPYLMGFLKFALLATLGELLGARIVAGRWVRLNGLWARGLVWGILGVLIVFAFRFFEAGAVAMLDGRGGTLARALLTSVMMNLTFGIVFMAGHRVTDTLIDLRATGSPVSLGAALDRIDWAGFLRFVVGRTIPLFWIPAHTVTFLLPSVYRVLWAAYLSIALGALLAYAKRRKSSQ
jgi:hypothetical protein